MEFSAGTSAGAAIGAGLGVTVLTTLGVHPQPLFWALAGATLGMSMAPSAGWARTAIVFVCVVLLSALMGTAAAARWADGSLTAADTIAALTAWLFHAIAGAVVEQVPLVIGGWLRRWSAGPAAPAPTAKPEVPTEGDRP